jgi:hypothetical protein
MPWVLFYLIFDKINIFLETIKWLTEGLKIHFHGVSLI